MPVHSKRTILLHRISGTWGHFLLKVLHQGGLWPSILGKRQGLQEVRRGMFMWGILTSVYWAIQVILLIITRLLSGLHCPLRFVASSGLLLHVQETEGQAGVIFMRRLIWRLSGKYRLCSSVIITSMPIPRLLNSRWP